MPDALPILGYYREAPLHAFQDEARLRAVIIPEIDVVHGLDSDAALTAWAADVSRSPESRLLAAQRLLAPAAEREAKRSRQTIDAQKVRATVSGLGSLRRAHPGFYASILDPIAPPGQGPQPAPRPPEHRVAFEAAQEAAR